MRYTKTQSQRIHAKKRCLERYGEAINKQDMRDIVTLIQTRKAVLYDRQSLRVSVWIVKFRGRDVKVVYDKMRQTIVSFLPM